MIGSPQTTPISLVGTYAIRALSCAVALVGFWWAANYSFGAILGVAAYAAALAILAALGGLWVALLPVAYAVGDLYPWTGSLLVSEADVFCAAALAVLLWRQEGHAFEICRERRFLLLWTPLLVCVGVGLVHGWYRLPSAPLGDQFSIYANEWNAVRVGKGFFWGFAFAPMLISEIRRRSDAVRVFVSGIQASAAIVALAVIWERCVTVGLLNFEDLYRPSGPIFSSHVGGLQIDAFWAIALPLILVPPASRRMIVAGMFRFVLLAASYYAIGATLSRGLIALAACQTVVMLVAIAFGAWRRQHTINWRAATAVVVVASLAFGSLLVFVKSAPLQERLGYVDTDWKVRWDHWTGLLRSASSDWRSDAIGNGLGLVPSMLTDFFGWSPQSAELFADPSGNPLLRLTPGRSVYVDQFVDPNAPGPWRMSARLSRQGDAQLVILISERTLYRSFNYVEYKPGMPNDSTRQEPVTLTLGVDPLVTKVFAAFRRPVTFALTTEGSHGSVEVSELQLLDATGRSLLKNADFRAGTAHWFFTSKDQFAWRADNLAVQLYVELGVLGVFGFAWLALGTLLPLAYAAIFRSDLTIIALTLSIAGFLAIGCVGSLVDTPNLTALFLALIAVGQGLDERVASAPH